MKSMLFKKVAGVGMLVVAGLALAQHGLQPADRAPRQIAATNDRPAETAQARFGPAPQVDWQALGELKPRRMKGKTPTERLALVMPDVPSGRLVVKFRDQARVRVLADADNVLLSRAGRQLGPVRQILQNFGASIQPAFAKSEQRLADIEFRVAEHSGYAQPDLAGMTYVTVPGGAGLELAAALNDLDIVEFVEFEPVYTTGGGTPTGACCLGGGVCVPATLDQCTDNNGVYQGDNTECGSGCGACCRTDGSCIEASELRCTDVEDGIYQGNATICGDVECQDLGEPACGEIVAGDCFEANDTPFCSNFGTYEDCCDDVCSFDPFCCDEDQIWPNRGSGVWDEWCADHALEICACINTGGQAPGQPGHNPLLADTPSFTDAQGYLTPSGYPVNSSSGLPPANIAAALRYSSDSDPTGFDPKVVIMDGYSGEGYNLQGLWDIGEILVSGGSGPNRTRGLGIRIGIVEHSAFVSTAVGPEAPYDHEELSGKIIPEPGQTVLVIPQFDDLNGNHGTATACVAAGADQEPDGTLRAPGFSPNESMASQAGIVGIAPDAELWFFPIVSIEAPGGRLLDAIASAIEAFDPGDVLSFSIGPGCGTLASGGSSWSMLRMAADLGITCCLAAGNDNCDLQDEPQAGSPDGTEVDCDAIIVGATYPGCDSADGVLRYRDDFAGIPTSFNCFCRTSFSNYCANCDEASDVHVGAWGLSVTTGGYGDLYTGFDFDNGAFNRNRTYTNTFNGTSAACPMIAGVAACLQGLSKQFFGEDTPMTPSAIRQVISTGQVDNHPNPHFPQCGIVDEDEVPGSGNVPTSPCGFNQSGVQSTADWNLDGTRNSIGTDNVVFTNLLQSAEDLMTNDWFGDNPFIQGIEILEGEYLSGSLLSLASRDENNLIIESSQSTPSGAGVVSRGNIASGKVTDVLVTTNTLTPGTPGNVTVFTKSCVTGGDGIMLVYMYDYVFGHWLVAGVTLMPIWNSPGCDLLNTLPQAFPVSNADRFIGPNGEVLIRLWTVSLAISPTYQVFHDWLTISVSGNPFIPGGSGGP